MSQATDFGSTEQVQEAALEAWMELDPKALILLVINGDGSVNVSRFFKSPDCRDRVMVAMKAMVDDYFKRVEASG